MKRVLAFLRPQAGRTALQVGIKFSSTLLELSSFSPELSSLPETESSEHATNKAVNALNKNILFIIPPS